MVYLFGRSVPELCKINLHMINYIYDNHSFRKQSWIQPFLSPEMLQTYANAIHFRGSPLTTCFGFIDGTVRPISRPGINQKIVFNGHKRPHGIKFQSICIPNGLIANLSDPWGKQFFHIILSIILRIIILKLCNPFKLVTKLLMIMLNYLLSFIEGRMHDARILGESGLILDLEQVAFAPDGTPLCLYGDPGYPLRLHLQQPIRFPVNEVMRLYNKEMSSVRVSVE